MAMEAVGLMVPCFFPGSASFPVFGSPFTACPVARGLRILLYFAAICRVSLLICFVFNRGVRFPKPKVACSTHACHHFSANQTQASSSNSCPLQEGLLPIHYSRAHPSPSGGETMTWFIISSFLLFNLF